MRKLMILIVALTLTLAANAQQYTGMSGLIHTPSAEMDRAGDIRLGTHFLNHYATPNYPSWRYEGEKYNTMDFYLSITPFSWVEIGYTMTLFKHKKVEGDRQDDKDGYNRKDRYFSIKFQPLKEGRYWPAIAVGANDFIPSDGFKNMFKDKRGGNGNDFWRNFYIAATKHLELHGNEFGATLAYRYYPSYYNHRWRGGVGGLTWRPAFCRDIRVVAEWTGSDVNVGAEYKLLRHFLLQASLQRGKYPSGGFCYMLNLN